MIISLDLLFTFLATGLKSKSPTKIYRPDPRPGPNIQASSRLIQRREEQVVCERNSEEMVLQVEAVGFALISHQPCLHRGVLWAPRGADAIPTSWAGQVDTCARRRSSEGLGQWLTSSLGKMYFPSEPQPSQQVSGPGLINRATRAAALVTKSAARKGVYAPLYA